MKIRVSIVEDNREDRRFFADLVNRLPDFVCSGQHANPTEALKNLLDEAPRIVLLDLLFMDTPKGINCVWEIKRLLPTACVLMLTNCSDSELLFECLSAGADGYVLKSDAAKLPTALVDACNGGSPMSSTIARQVLLSFRRKKSDSPTLDNITPRELQILERLALGETYKKIALELGMAEGTLRSHLRRIYEKLRVNNRSAASAVYARFQSN